jgi:hypothetical protein
MVSVGANGCSPLPGNQISIEIYSKKNCKIMATSSSAFVIEIQDLDLDELNQRFETPISVKF